MQHIMLHQPDLDRATAALQLWEAFHESKALAVSLRSAVRAESECHNLSELLERVSELLCHTFSRYNDRLFIGTLNSHVQSSAQLLHFGLLKVCRVVDVCCTNSSTTVSFSPASITSSAASAAADIQLAVTVLATAVQYLEATCGKQAGAAALQVLPGPRTSQQQTLMFKDAASLTSMQKSVHSQIKLAGDAEAIETCNTGARSLAGECGTALSCRASSPAAADANDACSSSGDLPVTVEVQPEVTAELTFASERCTDALAAGEQLAIHEEQLAKQQYSDGGGSPQRQSVADPHTVHPQQVQIGTAAKTAVSVVAGFDAAEAVDGAAYTTARLLALQELLTPGSTWCVDDNGSNFVCSTSNSRQKQRAAVASLQPSRSESPEQQQLQHQRDDAVLPATDAAAGTEAKTAPAECQRDEFDPAYCSQVQSIKIPLTAEELQLDEQDLGQQHQQQERQYKLNQEGQPSSTVWLQQLLQQVYSNALLQGRMQQQQLHTMLRRSQNLSHGVAAASEVLPSPKEQLQQLLPRKQQAGAESPEPAGWGIGFIRAGYNSSSGRGDRSMRISTEEMVENILGRSFAGRAATAPGGAPSACGTFTAPGMLAEASDAASAAEAGERLFVPCLMATSPDKSMAAAKTRGTSAPGSIRVSREYKGVPGSEVAAVKYASSGMVSSSSPRGYANHSGKHVPCSASAAGSTRSSRDLSRSGSASGSPTYTGVMGSSTRGTGDCTIAVGAAGASTSGSSKSTGSRRASRDSSAAAGVASALPHTHSSTSSTRHNKSSKDSVLASSSGGVLLCSNRVGSSSSSSHDRYRSCDETLTAAATSYATARSSFSGNGLLRYSSTGSAALSCTSGNGSAKQSKVSRDYVPEMASMCSVTSAAGAAVMNMLVAAAAGAEEAAAGHRSHMLASTVIGNDVDLLCLACRTAVQQSRRSSWAGRSSVRGQGASCSGGQLQQAAGSPATSKAAYVSAHGCLTIGSFDGTHPNRRPEGLGGQSSPVRTSAAAFTTLTKRSSWPSAVGQHTGSRPASSTGQHSCSQCGTKATQQQQQQQQAGSCPLSKSGQRGSAHSSGAGKLLEQQQLHERQAGCDRGSRGPGSCSLVLGRDGSSTGESDSTVQVAESVAAASGSRGNHDTCNAYAAAEAEQCTAAAAAQAIDGAATVDVVPVTAAETASIAAPVQDTQQQRISPASGSQMIVVGLSLGTASAAAAPHPTAEQPEVVQQQQQDHQQQGLQGKEDMTNMPAAGTSIYERQEQGQQWQQQWEQQQQLWQQQVKQHTENKSSATADHENSRCEVISDGHVAPEVTGEAATMDMEKSEHQSDAGDTVHKAAATAAPCDTDFDDFQCSVSGASTATTNVGHSANIAQSGKQCSSDLEGQCCDSNVLCPATAEQLHQSSSQAAAAGNAAGLQTIDMSDESANRSSLMLHNSVNSAAVQQPQQLQDAATGGTCPPAAAALVTAAATPEALAEALLAEGNAAYTAGRYQLAVQSYARGLDKLGGSIASTSSEAGVLLWVKSSLNLACCNLRLGQFKQCVAICDGLLQVDPANIVALCHRGRALLMVQQYAAAKADLTEALELLEDESAEQQHQQQYHLAQQQQQLLGQGSEQGTASSITAAAAVKSINVATEVDGAIRGSSRCLTPCTLAHMRLNNSYWQHRVTELLSCIKD